MFSKHLFSESTRPFVLLIALSLTLLVGISATAARPGQVAPLLAGLERDIGALRAQLGVVPPVEVGRFSAAAEAGMADGGAAYRWEAITTIVRGAHRRSADLHARLLHLDDETARSTLDEFRTGLHALEHRLGQLRAASDGSEAGTARADADRVLGELEHILAGLRQLDRSQATLDRRPPRPA